MGMLAMMQLILPLIARQVQPSGAAIDCYLAHRFAILPGRKEKNLPLKTYSITLQNPFLKLKQRKRAGRMGLGHDKRYEIPKAQYCGTALTHV